MARDTIPLTEITQAGIAKPSQVTGVAANDLQVAATVDDHIFIEVENTDAIDHDITIQTNLTVEGFALEDATYTIPAATDFLLIRIEWDRHTLFLQDDGYVYIDVATDTYLKFRAYKL